MKPLRLIWAALTGGVTVYACVALALITVGGLEIGGLPPFMMNIIGPLALVLMGLGLWMRRAIPARIPRDLPAEEREGRYQAAVIASLALIEGGGILMTTVGMIAGTPAWILVGAGAAVVLMVMAKP